MSFIYSVLSAKQKATQKGPTCPDYSHQTNKKRCGRRPIVLPEAIHQNEGHQRLPAGIWSAYLTSKHAHFKKIIELPHTFEIIFEAHKLDTTVWHNLINNIIVNFSLPEQKLGKFRHCSFQRHAFSSVFWQYDFY